MTSTTDLVNGFGGLLVAHSIGVTNPTGVYTTGQVGITVASMPPSPDHIISLSPFPVSDDAALNESVIGLRVRLRGGVDPRVILDRSAAIFNLFQGLQNQDFNGLHLALAWRQSGGLTGQDENSRWLSTDTYYCRCNWPTTNRPD